MKKSKNEAINKEARMYVLSAGSGYSCLGFEVVADRARALAAWIGADDIKLARQGSKKLYAQYTKLMETARRACELENKVCGIELTRQLIGKEGLRVEVETHYGEKRRFIVGKSTGWMPVHLEIKTKRSSGGPAAESSYKTVRLI